VDDPDRREPPAAGLGQVFLDNIRNILRPKAVQIKNIANLKLDRRLGCEVIGILGGVFPAGQTACFPSLFVALRVERPFPRSL
jgi:hypothetical protein